MRVIKTPGICFSPKRGEEASQSEDLRRTGKIKSRKPMAELVKGSCRGCFVYIVQNLGQSIGPRNGQASSRKVIQGDGRLAPGFSAGCLLCCWYLLACDFKRKVNVNLRLLVPPFVICRIVVVGTSILQMLQFEKLNSGIPK